MLQRRQNRDYIENLLWNHESKLPKPQFNVESDGKETLNATSSAAIGKDLIGWDPFTGNSVPIWKKIV